MNSHRANGRGNQRLRLKQSHSSADGNSIIATATPATCNCTARVSSAVGDGTVAVTTIRVAAPTTTIIKMTTGGTSHNQSNGWREAAAPSDSLLLWLTLHTILRWKDLGCVRLW